MFDSNNDFGAGQNHFDNFVIMVVPQSVENGATVDWGTVYQTYGDEYATFVISNIKTTPTYHALNRNSPPYLSGGATGGNVGNTIGRATLTNVGTPTGTGFSQLNNQTMRAFWQIRFENTYPTGPVNIYAGIFSDTGSSITSPGSPTDLIQLTRVGTWAMDMNAPSITVGDPRVTASNRFEVNWQFSDVSGFRDVRSYCYLDGSGSMQVTDLGLGQGISINNTPLGFPGADQCLVNNISRAGVHDYRIDSGTFSTDLVFKLYAEDRACNASSAQNSLGSPTPWILTSGNNVSAAGGFENFVIPNVAPGVLSGISPTLSDDAYLATYLALAGDSDLPVNRRSRHDFYSVNYPDAQISAPSIASTPEWYDLILARLQNEGVITPSGLGTLSGNLSTAYGVAAGGTYFFRHSGNLTVNSGSRCDINAVILVSGNLTIHPDFNRNNNNGCVFVVNGNITVERGTYKSSGLPITSLALYDRLHAFFVTDGTFTTVEDSFGPAQVADGLYLRGTIVANQVDFNRNFGLAHNTTQPAEVMEYDPIYLLLFRDYLSLSTFSLREL
jgi:hypothetical protein